MRDPAFAARFKQAGEAWEVVLQLAALREQAGLSQHDLARKLKTSQQQISRLDQLLPNDRRPAIPSQKMLAVP